MMRAENRLYTTKAGQYRSSPCAERFSMMDVIMAAAWKAMFRDG